MTTYTVTATATDAATDRITVSSATNMFSGLPIVFSGSVFGGITAGATYYIGTVVPGFPTSTITVTSLPGGAVFALSTAAGTMTGTFSSGGQQIIDIGSVPNDGTGDPLRTAFNDTNVNFDQIFAAGPVGSNVQIANNSIITTNTNGNLVLAPNGTGTVQSNVSILPNQANIRNLGSAAQRWSTIYTQYLDVSANLNIAGNIVYNGDLTVDGNLTVQGNIIQVGNIVTETLTIQLANAASTANAANGAGITVGANDDIATLIYNSTSNVWTTNIGVSSVGNITAPYFFGNGSQLTGLAATYGNANVVTLLAGFGSNTVSTTGNITGGYIFGNGSQLTGLAATYGNSNVVAYGESGWAGNIIPSGNAVYSLGNATNQWNDLYVSNATIFMNNVPISLSAGNVLTVNGEDVVVASNTGLVSVSSIDIGTTNFLVGDDDYLVFEGLVPGGIRPAETDTYNLGNVGKIWSEIHANVYYGNGSQLTGISTANTGNVTFNNVNIIGDENLRLQPDPANADAYLDIYLTTGPDIHIAGNGESVILGTDDYANVTVNVDGNVSIQASNGTPHTWTFATDGSTIFPTLTTQRGDNPSGTIQGQTLLFGDATQEAIISTPDGSNADGINSQRLVINPGKGEDSNGGEGGDIYLWAGRGGNNNGSGGDVKIRGGQGMGNTGSGGYLRIEAGDSQDLGTPGYIDITGGQGANTYGGYVQVTGGQGGNGQGGPVQILGGYGAPGFKGGDANIIGGSSADGVGSYGNVNIGSGASTWSFRNNGTTTFPTGNITSDTSLQLTTTFANVKTVEYQTAGVWDVYVEDVATGPNDAWSWIDVTFKDNLINKPQVFIENQKASDGIPLRWTFDENGNLTLPSGGVVSEGAAPTGLGNTIAITPSGGSDANQQLLVYPTGNIVEGNHLHLTTGDLYSTELFLGNDNLYVKLANTGNVVVNSNDNTGNTAQWMFGANGNLTLPGNIIAINYANGNRVTGGVTFNGEAVIGTGTSNTQSGLYLAPDPVSLTNDLYLRVRGNIIDEPTHIHFDTGNNQYFNQFIGDDNKYIQLANTGNIVINSNDAAGNSAQWTFGANGNLTVPGGIVGSGASPAPYLSGFDSVSAITLSATGNVTGGNLVTAGSGGAITMTGGNITGAGNISAGNISATGNVTAGNISAGSGTITGGNINGANFNGNVAFGTGIVVGSGNITGGNISATGNVTAVNFFGNGATLSNVATQVTGSWTVPVGNSTQSFTVSPNNTYYLWVDSNIANGIITWNATATVTNTNVPVVGAQYAWVYSGGGTPIDFTSIPNQFVGTANTILRSSVAPSATTNRFDFGINNTSGNAVTVRYGYIKIS